MDDQEHKEWVFSNENDVIFGDPLPPFIDDVEMLFLQCHITCKIRTKNNFSNLIGQPLDWSQCHFENENGGDIIFEKHMAEMGRKIAAIFGIPYSLLGLPDDE